MRISEFLIQRYGPVSTPEPIRLANFNLFYGDNEDGKTLTLEALVRFLFGKSRKAISDITRMEESPEGYLILERDGHDDAKLPQAGPITDFFSLSAEECRNLFIICNSDLTIARESEFYGSITERLTGLRTNHIKQLSTALRTRGNYTDGMDMINTRESHHLKKRYEQARELIEHCKQLHEEAKLKGFDTLEEDLVDLQRHARELERRTEGMEKARLQNKYENGKQHLLNVQEISAQLEKLPAGKEEDILAWQQAGSLQSEKEAEREKALEQYRLHQNEMVEEEQYVREVNQSLELNKARKNQIDEALKPLLRPQKKRAPGTPGEAADKAFYQLLIFILLIVSATALAGLYWRSEVWVLQTALLSGFMTLALSLWYYWRFLRPADETENRAEDIRAQAGKLGIAGNSVAQITEQIHRFEEMLQRQQQNLASSEGRIAFLQNACKAIEEERLTEIDQKLQTSRNNLQELKQRYGVENLQGLRRKLERRQQLEEQLKESLTILRNLFGGQGDNLAASLEHWKEEIEGLADYRDDSEPLDFDEKKLEKRRSEQKNAEEEIAQLQRQLRDFREALADIGRRSSEVLVPEGEELPPCSSLSDLKVLRRRLRAFLERVDNRQATARLALDILGEIGAVEEQKVSTLFGEDSSVSDYYDTITEGLYTAVYYNTSEPSGIQVLRRDGKRLSPQHLSGGAFDQLYLTIRLSLAEKLLHEERGFFIFDDPFLKSDGERLRRQMELLLDLSQQGWQILYFSAKSEVKQTLQKYIDVGQVVLQPVPGLAFKEELGNRFNVPR